MISSTRYQELNTLIMQAVPGLVAALIEAHTKFGQVAVTRITESYQAPSADGSYLQTYLTGESTFYIRRDRSVTELLLAEGDSCAIH